MARFADLTLDELQVLRVSLSGSDEQVSDDLRTFLLGQVKQQFDAKSDSEQMRREATKGADDEAT